MENKAFIINTYAESEQPSHFDPSQLHIIDNNDTDRTVIASYDLLNDKILSVMTCISDSELSISYNETDCTIQLKSRDGSISSEIDAKRFISDNYLKGADYSNGKLRLSVELSSNELCVNVICVDFPVDVALSSGSSNPIANSAVFNSLCSISSDLCAKIEVLSNDMSVAISNELSDLKANYLPKNYQKIGDYLSSSVANDPSEDDKLTKESEVSAKVNSEAERAKNAEDALSAAIIDEHIVRYQDDPNVLGRKNIVLKNYDNIVGYLSSESDGTVNLAMISKWNVADFGSSTIPLNLNAKGGVVTINDNKIVAVIDDVSSEAERAKASEEELSIAISAVSSDLSGEIEERKASDSSLGKKIQDEIARASSSEIALSNAISAEVQRARAAESLKVDKLMTSSEGKALIFNETDGGGAKFENKNGIESFVGVNDGTNGIAAQIYADKLMDGKWFGAKLDVTNMGMYYTVGDKPVAERDVESNEIATKGDLSTGLEAAKESIDAEIERAKAAESQLSNAISSEVARAENAEIRLSESVAEEKERASAKEKEILIDQSKLKEDFSNFKHDIDGRLASEIARAEKAENDITDTLSEEVTRAKSAEAGLSGMVSAETARAKAAEENLTSTKTEKEISDANGRSLIFNERAGGGAKIEDNANKTWSFVGVNQPSDISGSYGSMYVVNVDTKTGNRIKMWKEGFTYSKGANPTAFVAGDEIATMKDIAGLSGTIHFRGAFECDDPEAEKEKFKTDFYPVVKGDITICKNSCKEYLAIAGNKERPAEVDDIIELGDEALYATKQELNVEAERATAAEENLDAKISGEGVRASEAEKELSNAISDDHIVRFTDYPGDPERPDRKIIILKNHDEITGTLADGSDGVNLVMLSKWDVADFGSRKVHANINTNGVVTINDELSVATTTDVDDKLNAETTRATNAEVELSNKLSDEVERATAAESAICANVDAEVQRSTDVEAQLSNAISSEVARAETQEAAIQQAINDEIARASGVEGALCDVFKNLSDDFKNLSIDLSGEIKNLSTSLSTSVDTILNGLSSQLTSQISATSVDLSSELTSQVSSISTYLSSEISTKIWIKNPDSDQLREGKYSDLSVIKITESEYEDKVIDGTSIQDNVLYVISSDHINAYGQRIVNVDAPVDDNDAVNLSCMQSSISNATSTLCSDIHNDISSKIIQKNENGDLFINVLSGQDIVINPNQLSTLVALIITKLGGNPII